MTDVRDGTANQTHEPTATPEPAAPPRPQAMTGVDALVQLLLLRHDLDARDGLTTATMVSGYPGSPLGTFDLAVERRAGALAARRIVHRPGLNEELAAATVWGSQMGEAVPYDGVDGVVGAWYGKTPGLDRSGDVMKHANAMGSGRHGGVVMFCGDDPTAKSSTLPCDSQFTFQDAAMPVLVPADPQEVVDLGVHAFRLSRLSGAWVGLKIVTSVADGLATVDLDPDRHARVDPDEPDLVVDGEPWRHEPTAKVGPHTVPGQEALVHEQRLAAAQDYVRRHGLDRALGATADAGAAADLGIVCAGKTWFDVRQALTDLGVLADDGSDAVDGLARAGIRVLRLAMTYPLVPETVVDFARSVDEVLVVEEKRPFVETQLRAALHEAGVMVPVRGKRGADGRPLVSGVGELDAAAVRAALTAVRPAYAPAAPPARPDHLSLRTPLALPILSIGEPPARPPGFCSGCPHNRSTVFPDDALVGGGVGCHGIMYFEARHAGMKSLPPTPMGAEGVPWLGLSPFVAEPHLIQNLGDGTLSHSGSLAIRASVAAGANITFKILYNAAVAMTGGQDVTGLASVPALTRELEAEGVVKTVVCAEDPTHYGRHARWARGVEVLGRDELPAVQERLRHVPGVTVIVYDQRCAAEARRLRKRGELAEPARRVVINDAVCEGCGDCSTKSNCLSVLPRQTELGEKREIHDPSCNRDETCLDGDCPSFVTIEPARRSSRRSSGRSSRRAAPPAAPEAHGARPAPPVGTLLEPSAPAGGAGGAIVGAHGIYFTGIGGTGVVTANRVIAAAAEASGLVVGGADQTGLSQKAGSVVSHLRLARDRDALGAALVGPAGAHLYLSGDILQAAAARHLDRIIPDRTIAVVDLDLTPTAAMLQTDAAPPSVADLRQVIEARVGEGRAVFVESTRLAERFFANHLLANIVLLGAAYQAGGLPIPLADLERALGQRGGAASDMRAAFDWGRWWVQDPAAVTAALDAVEASLAGTADILDPSDASVATATRLVHAARLPVDLDPALRDLVARRTAQVVDYQDRARGRRFLDLVARTAARDDAVHGWALTHAVVESWFKLLTYKDEYEVARLHLKVDHGALARELGIDGPYRVTYHLHPPTLRRLGMERKLPLGRPYELMFPVLARMKRLRGTPLDLFGLDPDRKLERAVIEEYEAVVEAQILRRPGPQAGRVDDYDELVALAASAQAIKGYAGIKEAAVERWRETVARP